MIKYRIIKENSISEWYECPINYGKFHQILIGQGKFILTKFDHQFTAKTGKDIIEYWDDSFPYEEENSIPDWLK